MEEAVEAFKKARPAVLDLARSGSVPEKRSPKRKVDEVEDLEAQATPKARRLRSSARLSQNRGQTPSSYAPEAEEEEIIRVADDDDDYVPEPGENDPYCFTSLDLQPHSRWSGSLPDVQQAHEGVAGVCTCRVLSGTIDRERAA
jgi:E3 ubiquitin-protein ligase RAD18